MKQWESTANSDNYNDDDNNYTQACGGWGAKTAEPAWQELMKQEEESMTSGETLADHTMLAEGRTTTTTTLTMRRWLFPVLTLSAILILVALFNSTQ